MKEKKVIIARSKAAVVKTDNSICVLDSDCIERAYFDLIFYFLNLK